MIRLQLFVVLKVRSDCKKFENHWVRLLASGSVDLSSILCPTIALRDFKNGIYGPHTWQLVMEETQTIKYET